MTKPALLITAALLCACASTPAILCPDPPEGLNVKRLPACDANLEGCFAIDPGGEYIYCQGGQWVPLDEIAPPVAP